MPILPQRSTLAHEEGDQRTDADVPAGSLTVQEFGDIFQEMEDQPAWRARADREMDYVDGNQLNSDLLRRQADLGIPPAIENLIGPAIDAVCGLEAKSRADWRVEADSDSTGDELAKAMAFKLNQAERKAKADQACSGAYRSQISAGIGWVEVSRESNPFRYPYRTRHVHRNEIWWDMLSVEDDLSDARWLVRRKWSDTAQVKLAFPKMRQYIEAAASGWSLATSLMQGAIDGGESTDLNTMRENERGWSVEEQQWRLKGGKRVCLFEVWYRRWERIVVIKTPDGRVVEVDRKNRVHMEAIAQRLAVPEFAVVPKMRMAIFMGPHRLKDVPSPYRHQKFPYVAFWGKKEDRTGTPFGLVKNMMFMQDNVNATLSKLRWGLAAVRTERTKGAVQMTDAQFRRMIARPDADIVLNQEEMAKAGAKFEVKRDFQLSDQQFQLMNDSRTGIARTSGIGPGLGAGTGTAGRANSGYQQAQETELSTQMLADLNDNFNTARAEVGDLLLSLITEDMLGKAEQILVPGHGIRDDMAVLINQPKVDEADPTIQYLDNDVERAMLKVSINDVPSTSSYRAQQLTAMSEAFKSMPPKFQQVSMPYLVALMDLPNDTREDIIKAVREAAKAPDDKEIEQMIAQAVKEARNADARDLKVHELSMKYSPELMQAQIDKLIAERFETQVNALYASNQAAATIAMNPELAPIADSIAQVAGFQVATPGGVDPNMGQEAIAITQAKAAAAQAAQADIKTGTPPGAPPKGLGNPNPMTPARPADPNTGQGAGIETQRVSDNLPA